MTAKYSKIAILFHWLIAILVVANFVLASMAEDLSRAEGAGLMASHKAIGVSILTLSFLRLFWLLASAHPKAPPVEFFGLFDITLPISKSEALAEIGYEAHEVLTKPLFVLILLHVAGALKHQFIDRLPFLQRMWP